MTGESFHKVCYCSHCTKSAGRHVEQMWQSSLRLFHHYVSHNLAYCTCIPQFWSSINCCTIKSNLSVFVKYVYGRVGYGLTCPCHFFFDKQQNYVRTCGGYVHVLYYLPSGSGVGIGVTGTPENNIIIWTYKTFMAIVVTKELVTVDFIQWIVSPTPWPESYAQQLPATLAIEGKLGSLMLYYFYTMNILSQLKWENSILSLYMWHLYNVQLWYL